MNTNRREFLKFALAGAGGLVATSALPAVPTPKRRHEMTINYLTLKLGVPRPFTVLHLSDTHLKAVYDHESEELRRHLAPRFAAWDPEDALATSLAWAKLHRCDYVLHTGDLIDCATEANLDLLKKYFGANPGILYAPGNHEYAVTYAAPRPPQTEAEFRAINTARVQAAVPCDLQLNSRIINGVNFVMLDDVYGTVSPQQVERFQAEVKKGLPIILCQHVPFFTEGIAILHMRSHTRGSNVADIPLPYPSRDRARQVEDKVTADFIRSLKSEPLLKAILAGHYHAAMADRFSPTAMEYVAAANFRYFAQEITIY